MALLQIAEPGQSSKPHMRKSAIGIDLGTTNSLVATVRSGSPAVIQDHHRPGDNGIIPSVAYYHQDGSVTVGYPAKAFAQQDPENAIISIKRLMGRGFDDLSHLSITPAYQVQKQDGIAKIKTQAGDKTPVEVSADILRHLAQYGQDAVGHEAFAGAVITVPAYFDDAQRQATKDAAKLAGIPVLRLLAEPTAAALAYGIDHQDKRGYTLVYDLGGGTFDVSLLELTDGVFEVLGTGGDTALGGDDFDQTIAALILQSAKDIQRNHLETISRARLIQLAKKMKEMLSQHPEIQVDHPLIPNQKLIITRDQIESAIRPLIEKTLGYCKKLVREAGLKPQEIDHIILVGGSTRVPLVQKLVEENFGQQPLTDLDPDAVVALGAARQADALVGNQTEATLLLDVLPLSLGVETMGNLVEKIIPRNSPIPVTRAQEFTTYKDGQTAMAFHVMQGEREIVSDCRSLARFELRGIPPMNAGAAKIRVEFAVDADGLLQVTAKEMSTNTETKIQVKPSYGLDEAEITKMLQDSIRHAQQDAQARKLREYQVDAQRLQESLTSALKDNGAQLLSPDEYQALETQIQALAQASLSPDPKQIAQAIDAATQASDTFAQRRMDYSIRQALQGQSIDALNQ